jgi:hypothetical protein
MPVLPHSAASNTGVILPGNTSGSTSAPITVNPSAPDVAAIGAILWTGNVDASGADFTLEIDGTPMEQADDPLELGTDETDWLIPYKLVAPTSGNVVASFSGISSSFLTQQIKFVVVSYSGVDQIGDPTHTGGGAATTHNSLAINSVLPAHRVAAIHGVAGINFFQSNNQQIQANATSNFNLNGQLMLQDAPGAASVTCTAEMRFAVQNWGVFGFALTPAVVNIDAVLTLSPLSLVANASLYRVATPDPARTWPLPTQPGVLPDPMPPGFPAVSR